MMLPPLLPVYFFPGPEIGHKRDRISAIKQALHDRNGETPEVYEYYPYNSEVSDIVSVLLNGSLFSKGRLVIVAEVQALREGDVRVFKKYINSPSPEVVLIFTCDETPGSWGYPRNLANSLPKKAVEVFWEMFERDKRNWVIGFLNNSGLKAEEAAIDLLLDITEGGSDSLREACELLVFLTDSKKTILESDVDRILEHSRRETGYSFFERFCRRDLSGTLGALNNYSNSSAKDRILSILADPLTRLNDFASLLSQGLAPETVAAELKLGRGKRILSTYMEGVRNYRKDELDLAIRSLVELESWLRNAPGELRRFKTEIWLCRMIGERRAPA